MSGDDAALADMTRLRDIIREEWSNERDRAERAEARITELERENAGLLKERAYMVKMILRQGERADRAEARITELEADVADMTKSIDCDDSAVAEWQARAERAEAALADLRERIKAIADDSANALLRGTLLYALDTSERLPVADLGDRP